MEGRLNQAQVQRDSLDVGMEYAPRHILALEPDVNAP